MLYIFDWDGTISDSADKIVACVQAAARDESLPVLDAATVKNIIGLGLKEATDTLYPNLDEAKAKQFAQAYSKHFIERDTVPSPFFPNVMHVLTRLRDDRFKLAVATGKSRKGLSRVLHNLELTNYFDFSRCADETASKPHPLMLEELVAEAGCTVDQAVMIGDTEWDMKMADNIGMKKIAVSYGAHTPERLQNCSPDMFVDDFAHILDWRF